MLAALLGMTLVGVLEQLSAADWDDLKDLLMAEKLAIMTGK